jgi:hypothetical protein
MTFEPTAEQAIATEMFDGGGSMKVEAGAGTGKTSTLLLMAETDAFRRGQYLAFNRAIVQEGATKFPRRVRCNTAHSLAMRGFGTRYRHRLDSGRMRSSELARRLNVDPLWLTLSDGKRKGLQPAYLASLAMRSVIRFCQTADEEPGPEHIPYVKGIDLDHGSSNNALVRAHLAPALRRAWADLMDPEGQLPYRHDHYLKGWQLSAPYIGTDFILFDEAQDANPVMLAIVAAQRHAQLVFVGDSQQQIYEFTGAINALANVPAENGCFLTQSFRFGPAVAEAANAILSRLRAELRLSGSEKLPGSIGTLEVCDAILTRTNAMAVRECLWELQAGRQVHLVGGADEVLRFARAADDLQKQGWTSHPELACFESWSEVLQYVEEDPAGDELGLLVALIEEFGIEAIEEALGRTVPEGPGVTLVSTAHKAKGREWDRVRLAEDFELDPSDVEDAELRLLYVAITRARRELDPGPAARMLTAPVQPRLMAVQP